jgi:hypothetical protein
MIKQVKRQIKLLLTDSEYQYRTDDDLLWDTIGEAVEHDARLYGGKPDNPVTHAVYEQVFTIQEAINKAVAENRVVRFLSEESNENLRKKIDDLKGCKLLKPSKDSKDIAVVPETIKNFDFNDVE